MTSWMEERDRLVAQTEAFVQQVAAAHPALADRLPQIGTEPSAGPASIEAIAIRPIAPEPMTELPGEDVPVAIPMVQPVMAPRPVVSERSEIMKRVDAFRIRQARMNEERDAYYETMQAKIRRQLKSVGTGNEADGSRL